VNEGAADGDRGEHRPLQGGGAALSTTLTRSTPRPPVACRTCSCQSGGLLQRQVIRSGGERPLVAEQEIGQYAVAGTVLAGSTCSIRTRNYAARVLQCDTGVAPVDRISLR
jgi:hypothetical protein